MKYVMLLTMIFSLTAFAQTREELIQEYMKERNKMMREIMDMFNEDLDTMMEDDFFEKDVNSFFSDKSFLGGSQSVTVEQNYEKDGSISVIITPKDKNIQLDISTENNMITIKSETKIVDENSQAGNTFKSMSTSSMTKSIAIPRGYTAKAPTQEGEGIKISLVPTDSVKKLAPQKNKTPVKPVDQSMI
ncbi:MAG: hypothetical protein CME62_11540 [Halobacteriovoraceae bacterium]|nr:hypothetical protein [Halobacteriovoraceae bacterium]|tara:strand:- start:1854 stop:2420 length:567 start_codon:yes stop_codon:yes gene_type:complete